MPSISKIRFTNVIYEGGKKRYNDEIFDFDGKNAIFLLENGGGKTVFLQTLLQSILPHIDLGKRKIKETLVLDASPAHIAIEWIISEKPRRYALTAVSLYTENNSLRSLKYAYDYGEHDAHHILNIPYVMDAGDYKRPADKGEILEYYRDMQKNHIAARTFNTNEEYGEYLKDTYKIIPSEWREITMINSTEGGVEKFFEKCNTTEQLLNNLIIPMIEEAINSNKKNDFIDTFEKQREHFKQNKQLLEAIEEFKMVKTRVDNYVLDYQQYDASLVSYNKVKQSAKLFYTYITDKLQSSVSTSEQLAGKLDEIKDEIEKLNHKSACLEIAILESELFKKNSDYAEDYAIYSEHIQQLSTVKMTLQNIKISELKAEIADAQHLIHTLRDELSRLALVDEAKQLEDALRQLEGQLLYVYEQILVKYEASITDCNNKIADAVDVISAAEREALSLGGELDAFRDKKAATDSRIHTLIDDMHKIENTLSEKISENNIKEYINTWQTRLREIENKKYTLIKEKDDLLDAQSELGALISDLKQALSEKMEARGTAKKAFDDITKRQGELLAAFDDFTFKSVIIKDIYTSESTIKTVLEETCEKHHTAYEDILKLERISSNLADLYSESSSFTSDPVLEKTVNKLKQSYNYLALGAKYLSDLSSEVDIDNAFKKFPYWAISVVTSDSEYDKLNDDIANITPDLSQPVFVLTSSDVKAILSGDALVDAKYSVIMPDIWANNLHPKKFAEWKTAIAERALSAQNDRKTIYEKLRAAQLMQSKIMAYYDEVPYYDYNQLKISLDDIISDICDIEIDIDEKSVSQANIQDKIHAISETLPSLDEEKTVISEKLRLAKDYLAKSESLRSYQLDLAKLEDKIADLRHKLAYKQAVINRQNEMLLSIEKEKTRFENDKKHLLNDKNYKRVLGLDAITTDKSLESLLTEILSVDNALKGYSQERDSIVGNIRREERHLEKTTQHLENEIALAKYDIQTIDIRLSPSKERLIEESKALEITCNSNKKSLDKARETIVRLEENVKGLKDAACNKYGEVYEISGDFIQIKDDIAKDLSTYTERQSNLEGKFNALDVQITAYRSIASQLELEDRTHDFKRTKLNASYDDNSFIDFEYARDTFVATLIGELEDSKKNYAHQKELILTKREQYIKFCTSSIYDIRIRDMAIKGVDKNRTLTELLEFNEKITKLLERDIQILEDDKRQSDEEIQTFLKHMYTYVVSIINELSVIESKTAIKVDDKKKRIFTFNVPSLDTSKAKQELRRHLDRLLVDYDAINHREEHTKSELDALVAKRLDIKNLILVVLGDDKIKIKCRKVTNDLKISTLPMSWESSNKWSDGEKWSKNMTLFLGLLNYLSEKKEFLLDEQKMNRTVVLDNPFGKASSKHVLDPVFFIAKRLGFQIIAVTAHAEGEFVSNYFSVIYSGKLRSSNVSGKEIMALEKTINTAFLADRVRE